MCLSIWFYLSTLAIYLLNFLNWHNFLLLQDVQKDGMEVGALHTQSFEPFWNSKSLRLKDARAPIEWTLFENYNDMAWDASPIPVTLRIPEPKTVMTRWWLLQGGQDLRDPGGFCWHLTYEMMTSIVQESRTGSWRSYEPLDDEPCLQKRKWVVLLNWKTM